MSEPMTEPDEVREWREANESKKFWLRESQMHEQNRIQSERRGQHITEQYMAAASDARDAWSRLSAEQQQALAKEK